MNNWQEDLKNKAKELNIKEEKNGVPIKTGSSLRSGSISGRRRNVNLSNLRKEKIVKKGGNKMISAEAAKGDIAKLIKEAEAVTAIGAATIIILKAILVAIKVILTARTNTVKIMDKLGISREEKKTEKQETPETKE